MVSVQKDETNQSHKRVENQIDIEKINKEIELENNQDIFSKKSLMAAIFFALITIITLFDWSPIAELWYLTILSFFLMIISLMRPLRNFLSNPKAQSI